MRGAHQVFHRGDPGRVVSIQRLAGSGLGLLGKLPYCMRGRLQIFPLLSTWIAAFLHWRVSVAAIASSD
jgi:hypothetical protein